MNDVSEKFAGNEQVFGFGGNRDENPASVANGSTYINNGEKADSIAPQAQCSSGVCSLNWKPLRPAA